MGQEETVRKERQCRHCEGKFYTSANLLKIHAEQCERAKKIGIQLVGGGIVDPAEVRLFEP